MQRSAIFAASIEPEHPSSIAAVSERSDLGSVLPAARAGFTSVAATSTPPAGLPKELTIVRRANILAHRGLWTEPAEKNSRNALRLALERGFGIETDFRDSSRILWVSHDPVSEATALEAQVFFEDCSAIGGDGRLLLNIKADGLQTMIADAIAKARLPLERTCAFDMSVPDALGYVKRSFPVYSRVSEYEAEPSFATSAAGVWVDSFTGHYPQVSKALELLASGFRVSIVSPELHGRPHEELWREIRAAALHENPRFELCTDFPEEAYRILGSG